MKLFSVKRSSENEIFHWLLNNNSNNNCHFFTICLLYFVYGWSVLGLGFGLFILCSYPMESFVLRVEGNSFLFAQEQVQVRPVRTNNSSIELYSHGYPAPPGSWMYSDVTGEERTGKSVRHHSETVEVTSEHLHNKKKKCTHQRRLTVKLHTTVATTL